MRQELTDKDSKSPALKSVPVRVRPLVPHNFSKQKQKREGLLLRLPALAAAPPYRSADHWDVRDQRRRLLRKSVNRLLKFK
jgi:hypothetical protein